MYETELETVYFVTMASIANLNPCCPASVDVLTFCTKTEKLRYIRMNANAFGTYSEAERACKKVNDALYMCKYGNYERNQS